MPLSRNGKQALPRILTAISLIMRLFVFPEYVRADSVNFSDWGAEIADLNQYDALDNAQAAGGELSAVDPSTSFSARYLVDVNTISAGIADGEAQINYQIHCQITDEGDEAENDSGSMLVTYIGSGSSEPFNCSAGSQGVISQNTTIPIGTSAIQFDFSGIAIGEANTVIFSGWSVVIDDGLAPRLVVNANAEEAGGATVNIAAEESGSGLAGVWYAAGSHSADAFPDAGTAVTISDGSGSFFAASGGIYTVYAEDNRGRTTLQNVDVNTYPTLSGLANQATAEDTALIFSFNVSDSETAAESLAVSATSSDEGIIANGSIQLLNNAGNINFSANPAGDANGALTLTVRVTDGGGLFREEDIAVEVSAVNDTPTANPDSATTDEDTPIEIAVLANDLNPDKGTLAVAIISEPASGSVAVNPGGTITFTPAENDSSSQVFTYQITDPIGEDIASADVNVSVNAVNDAPIANDDSANMDEDSSISIDVLSNDSDIEGGAFAITGNSEAGHGSVTLDGDLDSFTYTPNADYFGPDVFTYTITETGDATASATASVHITVNNVNDLPVTNYSASISTDEDTPITESFSAIDPDPDTLSTYIKPGNEAAHGEVALGEGSYTYTPAADFAGTDSFTITVSDGTVEVDSEIQMTVNAVDDAPNAVYASTISTDEDTETTEAFSASDPDNDPLTITIAEGDEAAHGTVVVGEGAYTYTPLADFHGTDSFTITVSDGTTDVACLIEVTVNSVNDAPVPEYEMAISTDEDTATTQTFTASDADLDPLTYLIQAGDEAAHGSVILFEGGYTYTPDENYHGEDSFTITVSDGNAEIESTISVNVNAVNDAPAANYATHISTNEDTAITEGFSASDADEDALNIFIKPGNEAAHGNVTIETGQYVYTPNADYEGADSFIITVSDGNAEVDCPITVTINAVNDAPVPNYAETISTDEDSAITETITATDVDEDLLSFVIKEGNGAAHGSVLLAEGQYTYTPGTDFHGTDSFTITVSDGTVEVDCLISVTIHSVNDAPIPVYDANISTDEDNMISPTFSASDVDLDILSYSIKGGNEAAHGSVVLGEGNYTYSPDADYFGSDQFTITVSDGTTEVDSVISVTVNPINDLPVPSFSALIETNEDTMVTKPFTATDVDPDTLVFSIKPANAPSSGEVVLGDGEYTYNPDADFNGTDSFTITVTDGTAEVDSTITVTVNAVNDAPVPSYTADISTDEDVPVTMPFTATDVDLDALNYSIKAGNEASHGSVSLIEGGYIYSPNTNYNGSDNFTITVSDGTVDVDSVISVTINALNDTPTAGEDSKTTIEDTAITIDVLENDSDIDIPEGDFLTVSAVTTAPAYGEAVITGNQVTYTPDANYFGSDSFVYEISDSGGATASANVTLYVTSVNDAPVPEGLLSEYSTAEDTAITISFNLTDVETPTETLTMQVVSGNTAVVTQDRVSINGLEDSNPAVSITINPRPNQFGDVPFTLRTSDGFQTAVYSFTLHVTAVNDPPIARNDPNNFIEDATATITISTQMMANDSDIDNVAGELTFDGIISTTSEGILTENGDGTLTYAPAANFDGSDSFTYRIADPDGAKASATVTLNAVPENDAPIISAIADQTIDEDTSLAVNFSVDDYDLGSEAELNTLVITTSSTNPDLLDANNMRVTGSGNNRTFTAAPLSDKNGPVAVTITVSDGIEEASTTFDVTINPIPDDPTAEDDFFYVNDAIGNSIDPIANDWDADEDSNLTPSIVTGPATGTLTADGTGYIYHADSNFDETDSFTYFVTDSTGRTSATATVVLSADPSNRPPTITEIANQLIFEDDAGSVSFSVADENDNLDTVSATSQNTALLPQANLSMSNSGQDYTLGFTPSADAFGQGVITISATDTRGNITTASFKVRVVPLNDLPSANDDIVSTNEDSSVAFNVISNDTDKETASGDLILRKVLTYPTHGRLAGLGGGQFRYYPNANYNGSDSFTYEMSDTDGGVDSASVTIAINSVNDAPEANANYLTTIVAPGDTLDNINVIGNDTDPDFPYDPNEEIEVTRIVSQPSCGSAYVNPDGTLKYEAFDTGDCSASWIWFTYEIEDHYGATDTASVSIAVDDAGTNLSPRVTNAWRTIQEDAETITIDLSGHAFDPDGDTITFDLDLVSPPDTNMGTATITGNVVSYTPNANANGTYSDENFGFTVFDGTTTVNGTIYIEIAAVNDAPTISMQSDSVVPIPDQTTDEDQAISFSFYIDDVDKDDLHGVMGIEDLGLSIYSDNTALICPTSIAFTRDNTSGRIDLTLTPIEDESGTANITIEVTDSITYTTDTFQLTVIEGNDPPIASDYWVGTDEEEPIDIDVIDNVLNVDDDTITISAGASGPSHGSISFDQTAGTITYSPEIDYNGTDSFDFVLTDEGMLTDGGTVYVTVNPVNDPPDVYNLASNLETAEDTSTVTVFNVADIDTDLADMTLSVIFSDPALIDSYVFTKSTDGSGEVTLEIIPADNMSGAVEIDVTATDVDKSDTESTMLVIYAVNDPPNVTDDAVTTDEDQYVTINVIANDTDIEDPNTLYVVSNTSPRLVSDGSAGHGSIRNNNDGTLTYTPANDRNEDVYFTYELSDSGNLRGTGVVTITINAVNDAPRAANDSRTIDEDTAVTISVLSNDYDVESDAFSVSTYSDPPHGSVVFNPGDQTFTYTPDADYYGPDSFTYTVAEDGDATKTDTATVSISIRAEDDYPIVSTSEPWVIDEDSTEDFSVTISDAETSSANLLITFTSLDTTLIKSHNVILQGSGTLRTVRLTPEAQMNGSLQLQVDVNDGALTTTEYIEIVIVPVNDPPVAQDYTAVVDEDQSVSGMVVVKSDIDLLHEGDFHTYALETDGTNGEATVQADGNWSYTPNAHFNGVDSFTVTITDSYGASATSTVTVTINKVNDIPIITSGNFHTIDEDTSVTDTIVVLDPDTGDAVDPDSHTWQVTTESTHGTVTLNGSNGEYTYAPDAHFNGSDSFVVKVTDEHGAETNKTIFITVDPVNDAPVGNDDSATIDEDEDIDINVLANDTDIDLSREGDDLIISAVSGVNNGTVAIAPDGKSLNFDADPDWFGTEVFIYTVTDQNNASDQAEVTVTVNAVNDGPIISDITDQVIAEDGSSGAISFTVTDVDNDDGSLVVTATTSNGVVIPLGSITLSGSGTNRTVTIDPAANKNTWNALAGAHEPVTVTLQVSDGSLTDSDSFSVTVTTVNDDPDPSDDSTSVAEDGSIVIDVLANDDDIDFDNEGDALTINAISQVDNAQVDIISGGTALRFTPDLDWFGTEVFAYSVIDTQGAVVEAEVTVEVTPVNDPPVISVISDQTIAEDGSTGAIAFSVTDVDNADGSLLVTAMTSNGVVIPMSSITLGGSGSERTVTIEPATEKNTWDAAGGAHEAVTITLRVSDGSLTDSEPFEVTVTPVSDSPSAADDAASVDEDGSVVIDVLSNDSDVDLENEGDNLTISAVSGIDNASVTIAGDGKSITFSPDPHWNGSETFSYTITDESGLSATANVTMTVEAVNDAPTAVNDNANVDEDSSIMIDVLGNDSDVDLAREGDLLIVLSTSGVTDGAVVISPDGKSLTYTPNADWSGTESFSYTVRDAHGATDTATVSVIVSPVNDDPIANDDAYTIMEDAGARNLNVLINDDDEDLPYGDALEIVQILSGPSNGNAVIDTINNQIIYTANANFNGSDSITYQIKDNQNPAVFDSAVVAITVTSVNDLPVVTSTNNHTIQEDNAANGQVTVSDVDVNDQPDPDSHSFSLESDALHGSVALGADDGSYTYTPDANYNGSDSFVVLVTDERGGSVSRTVTITISAINDVPVVNDASYNTPENTSVNESVDAIDPDVSLNGDILAYSVVSWPTNGSLTLDPNSGAFTYAPDEDYNGTDSFTVEVQDQAGESDQGVISLFVNYYENDPMANNDSYVIDEDSGQATLDVMTNDADADIPYGDVIHMQAITTAPTHGSASIDAGSDSILYTPDANFNGTDSLRYTIRDNQDPLVTDEAIVTITVQAVNDTPVISSLDHYDVSEDGVLNGSIVFSDPDVNDTPADTHTFRIDAAPLHGRIDLNQSNGVYVYTPSSNYNGSDSFTVRVTDSKGAYDTQTITVNMTWLDDDPIANDDTYTMKEGAGWKTMDVVANDNDADQPYGDILTITQILTQPSHGTAEINNTTNTLRYKPNSNFHGTDTFIYEIRDNQNPLVTASAMVKVRVSEVKEESATYYFTAPEPPITPGSGAGIDFPLVLMEDEEAAGGVGSGGDSYALDPNNPPANGTVMVDPVTGSYVYVPNADFNGEESFVILVSKNGASFAQEVALMILPVNDPPTTNHLSAETLMNEAITLQTGADDIDIFTNTDTLTYSIVSQPSSGEVVLDPHTGTFTFIPVTGFSGTVSFTIRAIDEDGEYVDCEVTVEVLETEINSGENIQAVTIGSGRKGWIAGGLGAGVLLLVLFFFNVKISYLVTRLDGTTRKYSRIRWVLNGRRKSVTLDISPKRTGNDMVSENEVVLMRTFVMRFKGRTLILQKNGAEVFRGEVEANQNGRMVVTLH